jgi:hypothetical protein
MHSPSFADRCAWATSTKGKVRPTLIRESPSFGHSSDLGQRIGDAAGVAAAEADTRRLRAEEVGDRDHVLGRACQRDKFGKHTAASDVQREIDTRRHDCPDSLEHPGAICHRLGTQAADSDVRAWTPLCR